MAWHTGSSTGIDIRVLVKKRLLITEAAGQELVQHDAVFLPMQNSGGLFETYAFKI
jgi:hypothetical protein